MRPIRTLALILVLGNSCSIGILGMPGISREEAIAIARDRWVTTRNS